MKYFRVSNNCDSRQDGNKIKITIESSTTAHEAGNLAAQGRIGEQCSGWTLSVTAVRSDVIKHNSMFRFVVYVGNYVH